MGKVRFQALPLKAVFAFGLGAWLLVIGIRLGVSSPVLPVEAPSVEPPSVAVGRVAPAFTLTSLDGKAMSLGALQGQPVVLLFWADWCPECQDALQHLASLKARLRADQLQFLAINIMQPPETVAESARRYAGAMTFLLDTDAAVSKLYNVQAAPTYFFIDRDGIVIGRVSGAGRERLVEGLVWRLLHTQDDATTPDVEGDS